MRLMRTLSISLLVGAILFLGACTSFPSKNRDPQRDNKEAFRKDLKECKEDHPESSAGLHFKRWSDCMNLKGWE